VQSIIGRALDSFENKWGSATSAITLSKSLFLSNLLSLQSQFSGLPTGSSLLKMTQIIDINGGFLSLNKRFFGFFLFFTFFCISCSDHFP